MTIKDKLNLLKQNWVYLFTIKSGKVIENGNTCYQVSKWVAWIFYVYYYSSLAFILILSLIYFSSIFTDMFYMRVIYALVLFLLFELLLFLLIPLNKAKCWEVYKIGK